MPNANLPNAADMRAAKTTLPWSHPGAVPLRFTYGQRDIEGLPAEFRPVVNRERISADIVRITVSGIDGRGLEIRGEYTQFLDFPVSEWCFFITNRGKKNTERLRDLRITGLLEGAHPVLEHGNGDNCTVGGYSWVSEPVTETLTLAPEGGRSCCGAFPYMRLHFEELGLALAVGWPGQWEATLAPAEGGVQFTARQQRFDTILRPGETMRTPRLTILSFTGDDSRGRNLWRRWYLKHVLPREADGSPVRPRLFAHTFRIGGHEEFTGITEENQLRAIHEYIRREMKPDGWWIDAGWYPCNHTWTYIGNWFPNPQQLPAGLAPIGKCCRRNGMDFLLWFEPERCMRDTKLYEEHREWLLELTDADGEEQHSYLVNYADPDCLQYMTDLLDGIIKASDVTIYRQDFNMAPLPYWVQHEAENRIGALENLHMQGFLRLWDTLLARNPGLLIDSCASGGTRNDLEVMRRSVPLQYTDVGLGNHPLKQKQYREMFEWLPYFRSHTLNWDNAEGNYTDGGKPVDEFAYQCALAPSMTTMIEYNDPERLFSVGRRMHPVWRKAAKMMLRGDYYPLTECSGSPEDWYAVQFDCPERGDGFLQVIRNTRAPQVRFTVRLFVAKDKKYRFVNALTGETVLVTSSQLERGLTFHMEPRAGEIWFYTVTELTEDKNER